VTHRNRAWRGAGLVIFAAACALRLHDSRDADGIIGLLGLGLALAGLALLVTGKRLPAALRVERSRHRALAQAIRARRRSGDRNG
jgi:hypothetical protein